MVGGGTYLMLRCDALVELEVRARRCVVKLAASSLAIQVSRDVSSPSSFTLPVYAQDHAMLCYAMLTTCV